MNKSIKICIVCVICISFSFIFSVKGQQLNETYLYAKADMMLEQYSEAGQKILSIPVRERTSAMYLTLGESYYHTGDYANSARFFAVADSVSSNPEAQLSAARSYAMMREPAKAVEWLQRYLLQRDKISESEISLDPAFENIERSREWRDLWNSREWYSVAERREEEVAALIRRNRHTDALIILDAEIANRTSSSRFYVLRAKVYEAMEQYAPAHENAQTAIRMRSTVPEYLADAANIAVHAQRYDIALENINRAVRLDPYNLNLYLQRANILRLNRRFDDARNDLNFYFKYLPEDKNALFQMGMTETDAGNPFVGIQYFNRLIDRDKSSPDFFMARARAHFMSNNLALADHDISQSLDLNPTLPEALHNKGIILHRENKLEDACHFWRRALGMGYRESADFIYRHCIR